MRLLLILILAFTTPVFALESVPAKWHQELSSTYLVDYRKGEHLILSDLYTGRPGTDAVIRYQMDVRVRSWGKAYSATLWSPDKKEKQVLTITLREMPGGREMRADFNHEVDLDGKLFLRFSGSTILEREN